MNEADITINVDNTVPERTSLSTGTRIGVGGANTITINFNEAIAQYKSSSTASDTVTISVSGGGLTPVTNAPMILASNGLSASYTYIFVESDYSSAVHGALSISISGGKDLAGNAFAGTTGSLTVDVGEPPIPSVTLSAPYDLGTQIKWSFTQTTGGSNPGGAVTGTVFYIAVDAGSTAPGQATKTIDGVTVNNGFDLTGVTVREAGSVSITSTTGATGVIFTPFAANGNLDVYYYFVGTTGNTSDNSVALSIVMN
jgi:hypothetical protein